MPKYRVSGTIELNWSVDVEAEDADEAEQLGKDYAEDGRGHDIPTGDTEVDQVLELPA